ncbi:MAG: FHA domain-containing protein [Armatimonadetes bacterium]|nr:FHA domain-containing protein [Armatimonadota bacterium]
MSENDGLLRITKEEVMSPHVDDLVKRQKSLRGESAGLVNKEKRIWFLQNWFVLMIAGLAGALLAWLIIEPMFEDMPYWRGTIESIEPGAAELESSGGIEVLGTIKVRGQKFLVVGETEETREGFLAGPLKLGQLKVGQEVGVYSQSAGDITVAVCIDMNPTRPQDPSLSLNELNARSTVAQFILFPMVAALIGLFIGAADGLVCRMPMRALISGGIGLIVGCLGGFVTYFLANMVYGVITAFAHKFTGDAVGGLSTTGFAFQVIGRAIGWALAGTTVGLGQGIALKSKRLFIYGLVGGVVGGLIGGLLFDPIGLLLIGGGKQAVVGDVSRGVGFGVIGATVGFMIGIVELLARDAWLKMIEGPLAGKEFLVFKDVMAIGSSPRSDIYLFNDDNVLDHHGTLRVVGEECEIESTSADRPVMVNNRPIRAARLRSGDQITLGRTSFLYMKRNR